MIRTIQLTVGIVIAMVFFGMMIYYVQSTLQKSQDVTISENRTFISGDQVVVTWKTSEDMNGLVEFTDGATEWHRRDDDFKTTHRVSYNISSIPGGTTISHQIKSCSVMGECVKAAEYSITI